MVYLKSILEVWSFFGTDNQHSLWMFFELSKCGMGIEWHINTLMNSAFADPCKTCPSKSRPNLTADLLKRCDTINMSTKTILQLTVIKTEKNIIFQF